MELNKKREKIREGITQVILTPRIRYGQAADQSPRRYTISTEFIPEITEQILSYLHSQGCVLKVDRELPKDDEEAWQRIIEKSGAGYVAVEPLIEEKVAGTPD